MIAVWASLQVLINLLGMVWLGTAVLEGIENSWMAQVGEGCQLAGSFVAAPPVIASPAHPQASSDHAFR